MLKPLNVMKMYGEEHRIIINENFVVKEDIYDPWDYMIDCIYGDIYPYSGKLLGYHCVGARVRKRLHREHPEIEVRQWSDDGECVFLFPPDKFDLIAKYAKPRRKRKLTEPHKESLVRSGEKHRFKRKSTVLK